MASGVGVAPETVTQYNEMKLKRKHGYLVVKIVENQFTVVDSGPPFAGDANFEEVWQGLSDKYCAPKDPCYLVVDWNKKNLVVVSWIPDASAVRDRMLYASSKKGLLSKLEGFRSEAQCSDRSDIGYASLNTTFG